MDNSELKLLFMIANAGFADEIVEISREVGVTGATILNARGGGVPHKFILGVTVDPEKDLILCIVDEDTAKKAMAAVKEKAGITTPAHCICFTMPVDKTVGLSLAGACSPMG